MLEIYTNDDYEVLNTLDYRTIRKKKRYSTEQLKFILPHDATESGLVAADFKGIFDGDEEVDDTDKRWTLRYTIPVVVHDHVIAIDERMDDRKIRNHLHFRPLN